MDMTFWKRWTTALAEAMRGWMRQMHEPLFLLAWAAIAGILLADRWPIAGGWGAALVVAALAAGWRRGWGWIHLAALCCFGLMHSLHLDDPLRTETERVIAPGGSLQALTAGVVTDAPAAGYSGDSWQFPLRVESLEAHGRPWSAAGSLIYVRMYGTLSPPAYGDRVVLAGLLRRPEPMRNPGEFDFAGFLKRQGFAAEFSADGNGDRWQRLEGEAGHPVMAAALHAGHRGYRAHDGAGDPGKDAG